jgi:hypothetical protein
MKTREKFRPWLAGILSFLVLTTTLMLWRHRRDQGLPSHQGRSVRVWFADYCRASVLGDRQTAERKELRRQESLLAMLSMGTSAVPFLVEQAFRMEPVSTLHSNLFELFQAVPEAAGGGSFIPPGQVGGFAAGILHELRPEASALFPLLRDRFATSNSLPHRQAVYLAGAFATVPTEVSDWLSAVITNTAEENWTRVLAIQSLVWLGGTASNVLPAALVDLKSSTSNRPNANLIRWLGAVGPGASEALPWIEPSLLSTNPWHRFHAAIALHSISPGHPGALAVLSQGLEGKDASPSTLHSILANARRQPIPELEEAVATRAQAEIEAWDESAASFGWCNVLDRIAPRRAAGIYRNHLRSTQLPHAAGRLLALERTNLEAARVLIELSTQGKRNHFPPLPWLREAASSNPEVLRFLEGLAGGKPGEAANQARLALAVIRFREAQASRGLEKPRDW